MEMIFPTAQGYQGTIAVGFRKRPGDASVTERVGTVVLKRTYDVTAATQSLTPSAAALPIFTTDDPLVPGNLSGPFRYEGDMVPFKPQGDVIVLGFTDVAGEITLTMDGAAWLERDVLVANAEPALFGWEPRTDSSREDDAGTFSEVGTDYPPQWPAVDADRAPLPVDFHNLFFNGYSRAAAVASARPFPYLAGTASIVIQRPGPRNDYRFGLRGDTARATLLHHGGVLPDIESCWERSEIEMHHDTLVIEPDSNRCYAVWRGTWDFDATSAESYRRLVVDATA